MGAGKGSSRRVRAVEHPQWQPRWPQLLEPLQRAEKIAISIPLASGVLDPEEWEWVEQEIELKHKDTAVLRDDAVLPQDMREALEDAGALSPVFLGEEDVFGIVLPEVRVETETSEEMDAVKELLVGSEIDSEILDDKGTRVSLRPTSNRADEALLLAEEIDQKLHPILVTPNFLRVARKSVEKPEVDDELEGE